MCDGDANFINRLTHWGWLLGVRGSLEGGRPWGYVLRAFLVPGFLKVFFSPLPAFCEVSHFALPQVPSHLGPEVKEPITSDLKPLKLWANTNPCSVKFFYFQCCHSNRRLSDATLLGVHRELLQVNILNCNTKQRFLQQRNINLNPETITLHTD